MVEEQIIHKCCLCGDSYPKNHVHLCAKREKQAQINAAFGAKPTGVFWKDEWAGAEDAINSPKHYNHNHKGVECIVAIEAALSPEEFRGYLKGNAIKYEWREKYKGGKQDIQKAQWYLNKLVGVM